MNGKRAVGVFLVICLALAILLLMNVLSPTTGGVLFAGALILLGTLSNGFRRR